MHPSDYEAMRHASGVTPSHDMLAAPIPRAMQSSGLSRSAIYRAAAAGQIKLLKLGRTTLVDMASVRAFLASLPTAEIGK